MPDVGDVLKGATDDLGSMGEPDVARAWRRGRHLRRRRVVSIVFAAVVVLGGVGSGALLLARDDSGPSVHVADGTSGAPAVPDSWTTVSNDQYGVSMRVPPDWQSTNQPLNHPPTDPVDALSAGTFALRADPSSYLPAQAALDLGPTDVFVSILVRTLDPPDPSTPPRPPHFDAAAAPGTRAVEGIGDITHGTSHEIVFQEHGREIYAFVVIGDDAPPARQAEASTILDSLVVASAAAPDTTTTALPATAPLTGPIGTTLPTPPTTYAAGSVEDKVRTAFLGWTDTKPLDAKRPYIEDFDQIKATMEQAHAQAPPGLDGLHGVIESVTIVDATHAHVVYGFVNGDQEIVSGLPGDVVKTGGKWLVTRDTVCASFALEGVHCPPRTG